MSKKAKSRTVSRSSIDGEFVTKDFAERNPSTTQNHKVASPKPKGSRGGKAK